MVILSHQLTEYGGMPVEELFDLIEEQKEEIETLNKKIEELEEDVEQSK